MRPLVTAMLVVLLVAAALGPAQADDPTNTVRCHIGWNQRTDIDLRPYDWQASIPQGTTSDGFLLGFGLAANTVNAVEACALHASRHRPPAGGSIIVVWSFDQGIDPPD